MDEITAISGAIKAAIGVFVLAITGIGVVVYTIASVYSLPDRVEAVEERVDTMSGKIDRMDCIMVAEAREEPIRQCL
jgi:ascorbate-specific PTS system EIIC-type component UlaA